MREVWVDTDCGVDDAFALTLLALTGSLCGVSTVFGNASVDQATLNAQRLMVMLDQTAAPLNVGTERPLLSSRGDPLTSAADVHGLDGLGGWSEHVADLRGIETAVRAADLIEVMASRHGHLLAIGPLTNLATALLTWRELPTGLTSVVVMGGAESGGNVTASAEFNFWADPEAAHVVLDRMPCPIVLVPLDLTDRLVVTLQWLDALSTISHIGHTLARISRRYAAFYEKALGRPETPMHDLVAASVAVWPELATFETRSVAIDCSTGPSRGRLIVDHRRVAEQEQTRFRQVHVAADLAWDEVLARFADLLSAPPQATSYTSSWQVNA